jgi:hypothetical protein
MSDPTQSEPAVVRVALDHGETVELDGGTIRLGREEAPSVLLRLLPWRARSLAHVLDEWSAVSRVFTRDARPSLDELELSRVLDAAADALDDAEPSRLTSAGKRKVPSAQRLAAVAVLAERERSMSALQRLALVDAAAWWLSEHRGGEELAYALLDAACSASTTAESVYLALIAPPLSRLGDQSEGLPS